MALNTRVYAHKIAMAKNVDASMVSPFIPKLIAPVNKLAYPVNDILSGVYDQKYRKSVAINGVEGPGHGIFVRCSWIGKEERLYEEIAEKKGRVVGYDPEDVGEISLS
jgi:hypothetical protein